jgi:hypothetical protein
MNGANKGLDARAIRLQVLCWNVAEASRFSEASWYGGRECGLRSAICLSFEKALHDMEPVYLSLDPLQPQ